MILRLKVKNQSCLIISVAKQHCVNILCQNGMGLLRMPATETLYSIDPVFLLFISNPNIQGIKKSPEGFTDSILLNTPEACLFLSR